MITAKDVHVKIQELSLQKSQGPGYMDVSELAASLSAPKDILEPYLEALRILDLIEYKEKSNEVFSLTLSGKLTAF
ncbi:MAG: hypothetical protein EOO04_26530 [Chitinophagaceae bacterium]|nr:MAG: hypothetical protein EOO04_26530 [Chitinophagaceae bacterium]